MTRCLVLSLIALGEAFAGYLLCYVTRPRCPCQRTPVDPLSIHRSPT